MSSKVSFEDLEERLHLFHEARHQVLECLRKNDLGEIVHAELHGRKLWLVDSCTSITAWMSDQPVAERLGALCYPRQSPNHTCYLEIRCRILPRV